MSGVYCKGSWSLGTACGNCERCMNSLPDAVEAIKELRRDLPVRQLGRSLMDADEERVVTALGFAWNCFMQLPQEHNDDVDEFRRMIHAAQEKVLARPARRQQ